MVTALITVAAIAWICQMAFGGWQIRQFNRAFDACASKAAWASGVPADASNRAVVAIALDENDRVCDTLSCAA
jgi:glucitol operon activator protein